VIDGREPRPLGWLFNQNRTEQEMATSSKVKFRLETLRENALQSLDERIEAARLAVDSYADDTALAEEQRRWRAAQEKKLSDVFRRLEEIDDYRLSKFTLDPIPTVDRWDVRRAKERLDSLEAKRSRVEAKATALVPDEDGNVSLTKTQLDEFFGL
jgi:hypothetical protein